MSKVITEDDTKEKVKKEEENDICKSLEKLKKAIPKNKANDKILTEAEKAFKRLKNKLKPEKLSEEEREEMFVPGTIERHATPDIVFRPIRSWHCNTFAGEGLFKHKGDGSGCLSTQHKDEVLKLCHQPRAVTHRIYWHKNYPDEHISSFLSYPDGMGSVPTYFWEIYPVPNPDNEWGEIERFYGDNAEMEMEKRVVELITIKFKEKFLKAIGGKDD